MDVTATDRRAIRTTIEEQLLALQQDNADRAFSFASPEIQAKFGTSVNFLHMVRVAYPAVYRPRSTLFGNLVSVQGSPAQEVILLSPDGELVKALYLMEKQPDGAWRIGGCFFVKNEE